MKCYFCGNRINLSYSFNSFFPKKQTLCKICRMKLEPVIKGCAGCGKPTQEEFCMDCRYWRQAEETMMFQLNNHSLFYYNDFAKSLMKRVKFEYDSQPLLGFVDEIKRYIKKLPYKTYYVVPVPLHKDRLMERGFNQSQVLSSLFPYPILDIILKCSNEKQSKKNRRERVEFSHDFELKVEELDGSIPYIIVDDIYTTGATVHKIDKLLSEKGVKNMICFTLFRTK